MPEGRDNRTAGEGGWIYNIQRFSVQDGPGIRTTVFFKGCSLRCPWCSNPESQQVVPQLFYFESRCRGCGRCVQVCPSHEQALSL
ncbi:MAG: 4Fe-4S binding protein [Deltaproteobacteria bacterium]|nr:4Fe-4S binding protein [Deltaproteobacteria bacterium]